jgi:hypothetical protein
VIDECIAAHGDPDRGDEFLRGRLLSKKPLAPAAKAR